MCSFSLVLSPLPVSPMYDLLHGPEQGILYTTLSLSLFWGFVRVRCSTFLPDTIVTLDPLERSCREIESACVEFGIDIYRPRFFSSCFRFLFSSAVLFLISSAFFFILSRNPFG